MYRARDLQASREVALKVLLEGGQIPEERFRREGEIAASLQHPGIVRVFSSGVAGRPWLAYELVVGARSFSEASRERDLRGRVELLRQAAEALEHAHAQGVVHRDVKPDNVLVDSEGRVRVTDFGLALGLDSERLTKTGAMVGTPYYMAPEQIRGAREEVAPPTDVWALGVMLYEVLSETLPFEGSSLIELAAKISEASYAPLTSASSQAPEPLARVCRGALQQRPADRYPSAGAFAEDLAAWLEGRRVSSVVAAGPPPGRSPWPAALALALGALGVVGVLALQAESGPESTPAPTSAASPDLAPRSPEETLVAILARPTYRRPAALRALLQEVPEGRFARSLRDELRELGSAPLQTFHHPETKGLVYTYVILCPQSQLVTSTIGRAYRWQLGKREPLETFAPATGVALVAGQRTFLGGLTGEIHELTGPTLKRSRRHVIGGGGISRLAGDADANLLAVSQHMHLSLRSRKSDGSYASPTFRLECPFDITGLAMDPQGSWLAVCGGNRVDTKVGIPSGFLWVLDPAGELLWKRHLPPRPETLDLIEGALYVGTTVGQIARFDPQGRSLPDLVSPSATSTRGSEAQFRAAGAHGSTLRDVQPAGAGQVMSLSGGPGPSGEVTEVRLWEKVPGEGNRIRHVGRLEIRGVCGVSLAVDSEEGAFYVGTRQGEIQVWSKEAVMGQRTYNAKANGTGRRTRGS